MKSVQDRTVAVHRLTLYPAAIIIAVVVGVLVGAYLSNSNGRPFSGDYPAFYGAGMIAASGDWDSLYDFERQVEAQRDLHPHIDGPSARYFAYPPQVAAAYRPLAALGFFSSYLVHTLIMGLLLWSSVLLARPMVPWLRGRVALGVAAALLFWPVFRSVVGGSNTALTIFLIVAAWRLVTEDRQLLAGVVLSGLLFKPQFAVPMVGLFLLARYWSVVAGAALGAVGFYLSGVALQGWGWLVDWIDVAREFGQIDAEINGHSAVSFIGFIENHFGSGLSAPVAIGWILAVGTAAFLSYLWWQSSGSDLDRLLAITMPGLLLLSLHAMSHDTAIIVITAAVACSLWDREMWLPWVGMVWLLGASQSFIKQIGWSPGIFLLLLTLWWGWLVLETPRSGQSDAQT